MIINQLRKGLKYSSTLKNCLQLNELGQQQLSLASKYKLNTSVTFNFRSKQKDQSHVSQTQSKVGDGQKKSNHYQKSSEYQENPILRQLELDEFQIPHKYKNCNGCGVKIQTQHQNKLGYIEKSVLKDIVDHNKKIDDELENGEIHIKRPNQFDESDYISKYMINQGKLNQLKNVDNKQFIEINDLDILEEIDSKTSGMSVYKRRQRDLSHRKVICYRCHQLKYQRNLIDQQENISKQQERNEIDKDDLSDDEGEDNSIKESFDQGELLATKDPSEFIKKAFKQVKRHSTIIFVIDATDLFATLNTTIIDYAFTQNHKIILAVNKIDALPTQNVQFNLIKNIVKKCVQEKFTNALPLLEDIILVSAKTGEGMDKISKYIIQAKMESKQYQHSRYSKNFYVMGFANTGKSSFINALNKATAKQLKQQQKEDQQNNPRDNLNQTDKNMIKKLLGGGQGEEEDELELTTSSIPGTTVSFVKSRNKKLHVNIYDTPGIPNPHQLYHYFKNPNDAKIVVIDKAIQPRAVSLSKDLSVFFGGLARIDQTEGIDVNAAVFMSSHVSVHITKTYKANEVFIKQYNNILIPVLHPDFAQVVFKRHVIDLTFDEKGKCNQDLEIFGLGWLSFTSTNVIRGSSQFFVYLPEGVECKLRQSFYRFDVDLIHKKIRTRTVHSNVVEKQKRTNISKLNIN